VTSRRTLKLLAALTWYSGGFILLFKGTAMLLESLRLQPDSDWVWAAALVGLVAGVFKVRYLFNRFCTRNLERIDALEQPRFWQFFRPGFFVFLAAMMLLGAALSRAALDNFSLLLFVVALDLSLATALLGSSPLFWKQGGVRG